MKLTLDDIFAGTDLTGAAVRLPRFAPDGKTVSFLKGSPEHDDVLDLWGFDLASGRSTRRVDAAALSTGELSDEERSLRERRRLFVGGIVDYEWNPDGRQLLLPIDGNLFVYNLSEDIIDTQLVDGDTFESDVRFSPDGSRISFVRDGDLFVIDTDGENLRQLTNDATATVRNGTAEFIAAEEMHRFEGYWWSPDSSSIAFVQTDESPVGLSLRYEIERDDVRVVEQRYPYTGSPNAIFRVGIIRLNAGEAIHWTTVNQETDEYLARLCWLPDSRRIAVQLQKRDQQQLSLVVYDPADGAAKTLITERSETWVNITGNPHFLGNGDFLWLSERDGHAHVYRLDAGGNVLQALTSGHFNVSRIVHVDEPKNALIIQAFADTPIEQHVYTTALDSPGPLRRLSKDGQWHDATMSSDGANILFRSSAPEQPPSLSLTNNKGGFIASIEANLLDDTHPFHPYRDSMGQISFGTLPAADGQALHYRLIIPKGDGPFPVVVTVYGGPGVQRVTKSWIPPVSHHLTAQGYAQFTLDNRGSSNRGKAFEAPIFSQLGQVEVDDQLRGVSFLQKQACIDPDRIAVFGHSYGGYMTLMLLAKSPGTFAAGVSVAPVTDWRLYDTHYTERYLGLPDDNPDGYRASEVFPWLGHLADPLLLIHGMADDNVLFTHTTRLIKVLQDTNKTFELMTYPGAKHSLAGRTVNLHRYGTMDRFFARHLAPGA